MVTHTAGGSASLVHFELYYRLRSQHIEVRPEIRFSNGVRADLVVFKAGQIIAVIEAKGSSRATIDSKSRQAQRYRELPYPVLYCGGIDQITGVVEEVSRLYNLS